MKKFKVVISTTLDFIIEGNTLRICPHSGNTLVSTVGDIVAVVPKEYLVIQIK